MLKSCGSSSRSKTSYNGTSYSFTVKSTEGTFENIKSFEPYIQDRDYFVFIWHNGEFMLIKIDNVLTYACRKPPSLAIPEMKNMITEITSMIEYYENKK